MTLLKLAFRYCLILATLTILPLVCQVDAREFKLLELNEASMSYIDFFPGGSDPLITQNGTPNRTLGKEVKLNLNVNLLKYMYLNNHVHGGTDEIIGSGGKGQFRTVGWEFQLGLHLSKYIDLFAHHHSQHLLDTTYQHGRFPVQDAVGIKIYFYRADKPDNALLD